jgi:hypothetical protein
MQQMSPNEVLVVWEDLNSVTVLTVHNTKKEAQIASAAANMKRIEEEVRI